MKTQSFGRIFFGLLLLVVGVGLLLDALGITNFGAVLHSWWPLVIIGVGISALLSNPRVWIWPSILIAFGVLLQLGALGIVTFDIWRLVGPVIVIIIGLSFLYNRRHHPPVEELGEDNVKVFVAFSGQDVRSVTHKFTGGDVTALFGGAKLDLRDAEINGNATLDIFCAFGGVDLIVPEGWVIKTSGLPIFGGWEDKTRKPKDISKAPVLYVHSTCAFGGFSVKN